MRVARSPRNLHTPRIARGRVEGEGPHEFYTPRVTFTRASFPASPPPLPPLRSGQPAVRAHLAEL